MAKKTRKRVVKAKKTKRATKRTTKRAASKKAASRSKAKKRPAARKRKLKKQGIAGRVSGAFQNMVDTVNETSALREKMTRDRGPSDF